jgi:hypothetical protein
MTALMILVAGLLVGTYLNKIAIVLAEIRDELKSQKEPSHED